MMLPAWLYMATLFAAGWFCCRCRTPYDPPPCSFCSADDDYMSVTISGMSNGTICTGCSFFNATFILARSGGNACLWKKTGYGGNCGGVGQQYEIQVRALALTVGGNWGFLGSLQAYYVDSGALTLEYTRQRWNSGAKVSFDCTATRTCTPYIWFQANGCSGWGTAGFVINP